MRILLMACAGVVSLSASALSARESHPDLTGRWQLNEKESENARAKFIWTEGSEGGGRRPDAGSGERGWPRGPEGANGPNRPVDTRARIEGSLPPAFGGFLEPARTLTISADGSELSFDDGRGTIVKLTADGTERKEGTLSRVAKWEGPSLVVDSKLEGANRLLTRYNLMPGTRRLEVYSMLWDRQHQAVTLRRVYEAAATAQ